MNNVMRKPRGRGVNSPDIQLEDVKLQRPRERLEMALNDLILTPGQDEKANQENLQKLHQKLREQGKRLIPIFKKMSNWNKLRDPELLSAEIIVRSLSISDRARMRTGKGNGQDILTPELLSIIAKSSYIGLFGSEIEMSRDQIMQGVYRANRRYRSNNNVRVIKERIENKKVAASKEVPSETVPASNLKTERRQRTFDQNRGIQLADPVSTPQKSVPARISKIKDPKLQLKISIERDQSAKLKKALENRSLFIPFVLASAAKENASVKETLPIIEPKSPEEGEIDGDLESPAFEQIEVSGNKSDNTNRSEISELTSQDSHKSTENDDPELSLISITSQDDMPEIVEPQPIATAHTLTGISEEEAHVTPSLNSNLENDSKSDSDVEMSELEQNVATSSKNKENSSQESLKEKTQKFQSSPTFDKLIEELLAKVQNLDEYNRMKAAVSIASELMKKGVDFTPRQLEESVKQWFKYEFKKSIHPRNIEELESLTVDDLKYLLQNHGELLEGELKDLVKYLELLKNIEGQGKFKELISDEKCASLIKNLLKI